MTRNDIHLDYDGARGVFVLHLPWWAAEGYDLHAGWVRERSLKNTFQTKSLSLVQRLLRSKHIITESDRANRITSWAINRRYRIKHDRVCLPQEFDNHQKIGVFHILSRKASYLHHAPGAGKSAQAIVAASNVILTNKHSKFIFIIPPTLVENWHREFQKWFGILGIRSEVGEISAQSFDLDPFGTIMQAVKHSFILVTDTMLQKPGVVESLNAMNILFLAVDEASRFKTKEASRTQYLFGNAKGLRSLVIKPRHVVLLDGSPMPNRPIELWAPCYAVCPSAIEWLDYNDFGFKYCGPTFENNEWKFLHSTKDTEAELKLNLHDTFFHTVTEEQLPNRPERRRKLVYLSEDPRTFNQRNWEIQNLFEFDYDLLGEAGADEKYSKGKIAAYRAKIGRAKIPGIAQYTREKLEAGDRVILFAWHRDVVLGLEKKLGKYKPSVILGGVSGKKRDERLNRFLTKKTNLVIGNISSIGRGLNGLQGATRAILGEWSYSDETNKQAEHRIARMGGEQFTVPCDYIVAPGFDEKTIKAVMGKIKRKNQIVG